MDAGACTPFFKYNGIFPNGLYVFFIRMESYWNRFTIPNINTPRCVSHAQIFFFCKYIWAHQTKNNDQHPLHKASQKIIFKLSYRSWTMETIQSIKQQDQWWMILSELFDLDLDPSRKDWILPKWTDLLKHGDASESMKDIANVLSTQHYQIWPDDKSCIITEIWKSLTGLVVCHFILAARNMDELRLQTSYNIELPNVVFQKGLCWLSSEWSDFHKCRRYDRPKGWKTQMPISSLNLPWDVPEEWLMRTRGIIAPMPKNSTTLFWNPTSELRMFSRRSALVWWKETSG